MERNIINRRTFCQTPGNGLYPIDRDGSWPVSMAVPATSAVGRSGRNNQDPAAHRVVATASGRSR